ncbi:MAG: PQQ-binding-like beta-propeller repeat protein, partial [Verrucomicrobia bacterium]|nr:PQQ-binding-like beta-propeller repeat protein [Verrucomicrobiota bacterium]
NLDAGAGPQFVRQPRSQIALAGNSLVLAAQAASLEPLQYQWQFDGADLPGATNAALALTNLNLAQAGDYAVRVSNAAGSATSIVSRVVVVQAPRRSLVVTEGQPVSLDAVVAGAAAPTYRWRWNSQEISGATNATLTLAGVTAAQVGATVESPNSFQWSLDGQSLAGQTNSFLVLSSVAGSQAGTYWVTISNPFGTISRPVHLSVLTSDPAGQSVNVGAPVNFAATAEPASVRYQWQCNGADLPGQTGPNLALQRAVPAMAGAYQVLVSDGYSSLLSDVAGLSVASIAQPGAVEWAFPEGSSFWSTPAIGPDGTIYAGAASGHLYAFAASGDLQWQLDLHGGIYFTAYDGKLYCLDTTGAERWERVISSPIPYLLGNWLIGSPAIAPDGSVYVGSHDGRLYKFAGDAAPAPGGWPQFQRDARHSGSLAYAPARASQLLGPIQLHDGQISFDLTTTAQQYVDLFGSDDVQTWTWLTNFYDATGPVQVQLPLGPGENWHFYRAAVP